MDELKPCPFCGNTPNDIEVWERAAECLQCGVKVHAETWEQRPIEDALNARVAALETALRGATHEVLFDPTGARHVMAIDMAVYHAAAGATRRNHEHHRL